MIFMFASLLSCNNQPESEPLSAINVASAFLESTQANQFEKAKELLLQSPENEDLFQKYQMRFQNLQKEDQKKIANKSVEITSWNENSDSCLMTYKDLILSRTVELMIIKKDKTWKVDLRKMTSMLQ